MTNTKLKKLLTVLVLASIFVFISGCTSLRSQEKAIANAELYVHRIPNKTDLKLASYVDEKGIVRQIVPWGEVTKNASSIGNSVANIVGAVKGNFGFPFAIVPELLNIGISNAKDFKEETKDQEVYKLNYVDGIRSMKATISDGTVIEINLDSTVKNTVDSSIKKTETKVNVI